MTILMRERKQAAPPPDRSDRPHRSVSQRNMYRRCPKQFRLIRIEGVWTRPDAWSAQGKAVHEAAAALERSGRTMTLEAVQAVFRAHYDWEISQQLETTPNMDFWADSGHRYPAAEDIKRRRTLGLDQCRAYFEWCQANPEQTPAIIDGRRAVEMEVRFSLGEVPILGYIDNVSTVPDRPLRVRDIKTGDPGSDHFQLGTYAVALFLLYGIETTEGDYWKGQTGRLSRVKDLSAYTVEHLTDEFGALDENIRAERFDPTPSPAVCRSCPVNSRCEQRAV
ncbi:PD-(D/E)XK nuclease family protein [Glycomyces sp. NPDC047010]|uniref:RecB family exonuclease n=1 Tax=Glycomyces sp. NPDC047010 TaxID=3155023 RepID=UPI0033F42985